MFTLEEKNDISLQCLFRMFKKQFVRTAGEYFLTFPISSTSNGSDIAKFLTFNLNSNLNGTLDIINKINNTHDGIALLNMSASEALLNAIGYKG